MPNKRPAELVSPAQAGDTFVTPFLATTPAGPEQRRVMAVAVAVSAAFFVVAASVASTQMARIDAFVPIYQSALIIIELVTAILLVGQYSGLRSRALLLVAGAYAFSGIIATVHLFSFPGVFAPGGLIGGGSQTAIWLYFLWHGGFPLFIISYALLRDGAHDVLPEGANLLRASLPVAGVLIILVVGMTLAVTVGHELLPRILVGDAGTPAKGAVAAVTWLLNLGALAALWWRRPHSLLDLWLMTVMVAWLFDIALAGVLAQARYDVGWYSGRFYGLIAASFVLFQLLREQGRYYVGLADMLSRSQRESRRRIEQAGLRLALAERAAGAGFWDWEIGSGKLTWSDEMFHLFGLDVASPASFEAWRAVVHPDDLAVAEARIVDAIRERVPLLNAYRIRLPSGDIRWIDTHGETLYGAGDEALRMSGICIDVTDRRRAEEALASSQAYLASILRAAPVGIAVLSGRVFQNVNSTLATLTGYGREELVGKSARMLYLSDEDFDRIGRQGCQSTRQLDVGHAECSWRRKDGSIIDVRLSSAPILQGELAGRIVATVEDITGRKRAEIAARKSEELNRRTLQALPAHIAVTDSAGRIVAVNQAWLDFANENSAPASPAVTVGADYVETVRRAAAANDPDAQRALEGIESVRTGRQARFEMEYPCHGPAQRRWFLMNVVPLGPDAGGGLVISHRDISARMESEQALAASEERYRLLFQQLPDGIFLADGQGRILEANEVGAAMFGLSREELLARSFPDIIVPTERVRIPQAIVSFANGAVVVTEWHFCRKYGSTFLGEMVARQLPDGRLQAILRDVTDRRRTEQALRDSESFHRQTLESIPGMVFTTRPDGYCDFQSQQWAEYTGVPVSEHVGDGWNALLHPDDQQRALHAWQEAVAGRAAYDLEYRVRRHDGAYQWFMVVGRPIVDSTGSIVRWFGVAVNIERIKQAERALKEREGLLRAITDHSIDDIFLVDRQHRLLFINPSSFESIRAAGYSRATHADELLGLTVEELFGPGEATRRLREAGDEVMRSGRPLIAEECIAGAAGLRHMLASRSPYLDGEGRVIGVVGVVRDITERRNVEAERLAALERQRDTLVREIHHRIKNHLQGVTGLMRNAIAETPAIAEPMEAAIGRILTIANVYGLQSSQSGAQVSLGELVEAAIAGASAPVAFSAAAGVGNARLVPEDTVPVALVVNELVTNALKHLDRQDPQRPVRVCIEQAAEHLYVEVVGGPAHLPAGFELASGRGLGTGLSLAMALLTGSRLQLSYRQQGDEVLARLELHGQEPAR